MQLSLQWRVGGTAPAAQVAEHASGPQSTSTSRHASSLPWQSIAQLPWSQLNMSVPQASTPLAHSSVHAYSGGQLTMPSSQASGPSHTTSQANPDGQSMV